MKLSIGRLLCYEDCNYSMMHFVWLVLHVMVVGVYEQYKHIRIFLDCCRHDFTGVIDPVDSLFVRDYLEEKQGCNHISISCYLNMNFNTGACIDIRVSVDSFSI